LKKRDLGRPGAASVAVPPGLPLRTPAPPLDRRRCCYCAGTSRRCRFRPRAARLCHPPRAARRGDGTCARADSGRAPPGAVTAPP